MSEAINRILLKQYLGDGPADDSIIDNSIDLLHAFRYYNHYHDRKDAIKFLEIYLGDNNPSILETKDISKISSTVGFIADMLTRKVILPVETTNHFKRELNNLPKKVDEIQLVNVADSLLDRIIAQLEELFDKESVDFSLLNYVTLTNGMRKKIAKFYKRRLDEIDLIGKDDQVTECYKGMPKDEIRFARNFYIILLRRLGFEMKGRRVTT